MVSTNFDNIQIYNSEQLHLNIWNREGLVIERNNSEKKTAVDAIWKGEYLDFKDSSNFDKWKDFRFDAVSFCPKKVLRAIPREFYNTKVEEVKETIFKLYPKVKLGTLFQNVKYQSTKFKFEGVTYFAIIDLDKIRKQTFKVIHFRLNNKEQYHLNDVYDSAFIAINTNEVKSAGAIVKWTRL